MKRYSVWQFSIFRILFGAYLVIHFISLLPYAVEIWGRTGLVGDARLNFSYGLFPNVLEYWDAPIVINVWMWTMVLAAAGVMTGTFRRTCAIVLWYGWACLFHRNNLIQNPGVPMVGWLLLAIVLVPKGEPLCLVGKRDLSWRFPGMLFWGAWIMVGAGYTISGLDKWMSPSWHDGSALGHLIQNPLARDTWFRHALLWLPEGVLKVATWGALGFEMCFGFLCLFRQTRPFAWLGIVGFHLGILSLISFADLTFGVLMIHVFTIDPAWFRSSSDASPVVFFDGVCGLCNRTVQFVLDVDDSRMFQFSPLQGETAQERLGASYTQGDLSTIVLWDGDYVYTHSTAVLKLLGHLGGIWWMISKTGLLVPRFIRDWGYCIIAQNRYKWFGKLDQCRLVSAEEQAFFLP